MILSFYQLRRWWNMLTGKSVEHVSQPLGQYFGIDSVKGYYNDFTKKVDFEPSLLDTDDLPKIKQLDGNTIIFPVAVFQYSLGCYDYFLSTGDVKYKNKFLQCAEWTLHYQEPDGGFDNFSYIYPLHSYGAMAQGEAASVLIRAFVLTGNEKYLLSATKAIDFMLIPLDRGGTTVYDGEDVIFAEYTHLPIVLNGWIFAWWGLYDYVLVSKDRGYYKKTLDMSRDSLMNGLSRFQNRFWSKYDLSEKIASPFYHNLHISQMQAMFKLTGEKVFEDFAIKWESQYHNVLNRSLAFVVKAYQKITEKL